MKYSVLTWENKTDKEKGTSWVAAEHLELDPAIDYCKKTVDRGIA